MPELADRLAALSPVKRALLARRLEARAGGEGGPTRRPRHAGVHTFRTSFAQERVWFLEQLAPGHAGYHVGGVFRAVGRLDVGALRASFAAVVARHESLRTTFVTVDGEPRQVVSPLGAFGFAFVGVDAAVAAAPTRLARAEAALAAAHARPFDVRHGPLLRVAVHAVDDGLHLVGVVLHHLVADGWSLEILVREVASAYAAHVAGAEPRLGPEPLPYADWADWQRDRFARGRDAALTAYWRRALDGAPYPEVPAGDRLAARGAARVLDVPVALAGGIRRLARETAVSEFVVLLTVWQLALGRWLGTDDVTVLSPVANRERPEVAGTIGFFVNLVALRTRLAGDRSVRALLATARETVLGALAHQALPFERVLTTLGADRTLARPPLSPFAFALRTTRLPIVLPDVVLTPMTSASEASQTDLTLVAEHEGDGLALRIEFHRDLYDASVVERLGTAVVAWAERVVADPEGPPGAPRPAPRTRIVLGDDAGAVTVWSRFTRQAAETPDAVALQTGTAAVSYAALWSDAAEAADRLAEIGVARGAVAAVWGDRGRTWVAAMLGIWRRGAVYLPLDPRWPPARVRQVLAESAAAVVVTGPVMPPVLEDANRAGSCRVLRLGQGAGGEGGAVGAVLPRPGDLAYVVYTSGSTGRPKGALVEHAGLSNHLDAKIALLGLGVGDRVAQTAAAGFDISLWQVLAPLLVGAAVQILDEATVRDPRALAAAIRTHGITVAEVVPPMLQLLLAADDAATPALGGLRWLLVTGEALSPGLARDWLARHPGVPLVNAYGPTECADDVTHQVLRTPPPAAAVRVPIGRPIRGMRVHVLDERLRPVAVGDAGELCVGGLGVGRGYLGDPERTAAAFVVPDPFDGRPGSRLYRTGDRGRQRADGAYEWLGRLDEQVKIRGMRVEPAEVEAILAAHPDVREAAVLARPGSEGTLQLVGYVASDHDVTALRAFAGARLPEPMVPARLVRLPALPRTANGKVDRAALAAIDPCVAEPGEPETATPLTPSERMLADLWREVLDVDVRSAEAHFFALGGDSLATIRLVASARRHRLILTPQQVFAHPTLAALARVAASAPDTVPDQDLVIGPLPPTPIQRLLLEADVTNHAHFNMAMLLESDAPLQAEPLAIAVERLVRHHDGLRLRFAREDGRWEAHVDGLDGAVPCAFEDLADLPDAEAGAAIEARCRAWQASLDLARGPLVRVVGFHLGSTRPSRLLVVVHHLACDAASWPILLEDLATVYAQVVGGEPIALPAKTTSYRAWAHRLAAYADAMPPDERAFWEAQDRAGAPGCAGADEDGGRIAAVERHAVDLDAGATAAMLRASRARGVGVEAMLLSAVVTSLAEREHRDELAVFLERHGRAPLFPDLDVSRTVGWFTAVFPLSLRVAASRRPADTLALVDAALRAIPNGGVGWGITRCAPGAARGPSGASGRPTVSFNYLGRIDPPARTGWRRARESPGPEVGLDGRRPTVLDVTAQLAGGCLGLDWQFDGARHDRGTIAALAERTLAVVRALVGEGGAS